MYFPFGGIFVESISVDWGERVELGASTIFQNKVIDKRLRSLRLLLYCSQYKAFIQGFPKHRGITDTIRVTHENNGILVRKGGSSLCKEFSTLPSTLAFHKDQPTGRPRIKPTWKEGLELRAGLRASPLGALWGQ